MLQALPAAAIIPCQEPPTRLWALQSLWCSSPIYSRKVTLIFLTFLSWSCVSVSSKSRVTLNLLFSFFCLVHEGTLVHAVSVLSQWSNRLTVEVPVALLDWFKKAFTLKTSTSLVRHAYLQAMLGAFKGQWDARRHYAASHVCSWLKGSQTLFVCCPGDTLAQASDLIPLLLQTIEKAAAQNSQHALLAEGVAASVLLSRLALLETQTGVAFVPAVAFCHL